MVRSFARLTAALVLLAPAAAFAHTGGEASGFAHGFGHPMTGTDHILAMVLIGVLAWQQGGRMLAALPATFVLFMVLGGALGMAGVAVPLVEPGIALSVLVLGAAVALAFRGPAALSLALAGLFAIFHGHAHGAEMPAGSGGVGYALGFVLGTALLHLGGIGLGAAIGAIGARAGGRVVRAVGGLAALAGGAMLTGAL